MPLWKGWRAAAGSMRWEARGLPLGRALSAGVRLHLSIGWRQAAVVQFSLHEWRPVSKQRPGCASLLW